MRKTSVEPRSSTPMMLPRGRALLLYGTLTIAACWLRGVPAQSIMGTDQGPGISVTGLGEVRAKPDTVSIDVTISGNAELTGDALVKYRDAKRRLEDALAGLKLDELSVDERGVTIGSTYPQQQMQMMMMRGIAVGAGNDIAKSSMTLSGSLTVRLGNVRDKSHEELMETIGRMLDVAKDGGAGVGATPEEINMAMRYGQQTRSNLVRFVLRDFSDLREQAYEAAFADARGRAERLARLSGAKLAGVRSVHEVQVSGDDPGSSVATVRQPWELAVAANVARKPEITSDIFGEIPVRVRLFVRFDIDKPKAE